MYSSNFVGVVIEMGVALTIVKKGLIVSVKELKIIMLSGKRLWQVRRTRYSYNILGLVKKGEVKIF